MQKRPTNRPSRSAPKPSSSAPNTDSKSSTPNTLKNRKADTRRKILLGAIVMGKARTNPTLAAQLKTWLDEGLKTESERKLFGLPIRTDPP